MTDNQQALKVMIEKAQKVAIIGHQQADGDCVGSLVGLGKALEKLGKTVSLYSTPATSTGTFHFLPGAEKIQETFETSREYDMIVCVDFSEPYRMGQIYVGHEAYFEKYTEKMAIIDHHLSNNPPHPKVRIHDVTSSSASELIYETLDAIYPDLIDGDIATALYLGLTTDTANFIHEQDSVRTMSIALDLLKKGANKRLIIDSLYKSNTLVAVKFMGMVLDRLTVKKWMCYTRYHEDEATAVWLDKEDADQAQGIIQSIKSPSFSVLLSVREGKLKLSLRSKDLSAVGGSSERPVNCSRLAQHFGGGGHIYAAGATLVLETDRLAQVHKVAQTIEEMLPVYMME